MSLLTAEQAAELLAVTPDTVREWARRGMIPAAKLGREWRFVAEQLRAHVEDAAQKNVRCPSTSAPARRISGVDSRSVVERFAKAPAPQTAARPRNTKPTFAVVTGGKSS